MKRLLLFLGLAVAQDTLGLSGGYTTLTTTNFAAQIVKNAQVLASLKPTGNSFDYSPNDVLSSRAANKQNHLGDITLRYRTVGGSTWTSASSADARAAVTAGTTGSNILASSNLKPTLPNGIPLDVTRSWTNVNGDLGLSFTIKNTGTSSIEIGALGFPIEFNSIFTNRNADQIQAKCSLIDPYIGNGAGYVQVTPVNGNNPALVVTGLNGTNFEGWRFLPETSALSYQSQVFEGFHEWLVYTKAWAENEWKSTTPWNAPTSRTVAAGESFTVGLRLSLGKGGVRDIETAVKAAGIPYATSVPGYIIPQDSKAKLFLDTSASVSSISFSPSGAFTSQQISGNNYYLTPSGSTWGRVRVTVAYSNGISQTLHYYITKSAPTAVNDLGNFLTNQQWFSDTSDPFDRAPSVITYDRETNKQVVQDDRVWIAGLSDEGGAGSFLAATMKQAIRPNAAEIKKLESFMTQTLWGTIQTTNYGVRKSVFYYGLSGFTYDSSLNWGSWTSWNKASAYATDRAYDYVHVTAAYWAFYRVARAYPSLVTQQTWSWYLNQAYQTIMFCTAGSVGYSDDGLMGETVWGSVLKDLQREGLTSQASQLEARMKTRAQRWDSLSVPYGSEMAWDSTGQEGVYYWTNYFGLTNTASKTIKSILGYMPTVGHWGYNGNARRYWDNIYGGKLRRVERQIHHYGSGLNSQPLLSQWRKTPTDTYLLRVGFGGNSGPLSNIDQAGFASASFHSWPDTLKWDGYSGDYGPGFVGLALNSGVYIAQDSSKGTLVFGGDQADNGAITPRDASRKRVFVGSMGVGIEIDAGAITQVTVSGSTVTLTVSQGLSGEPAATAAIVWVDNYTGGSYKVTSGGTSARGGTSVTLSSSGTTITVG